MGVGESNGRRLQHRPGATNRTKAAPGLAPVHLGCISNGMDVIWDQSWSFACGLVVWVNESMWKQAVVRLRCLVVAQNERRSRAWAARLSASCASLRLVPAWRRVHKGEARTWAGLLAEGVGSHWRKPPRADDSHTQNTHHRGETREGPSSGARLPPGARATPGHASPLTPQRWSPSSKRRSTGTRRRWRG